MSSLVAFPPPPLHTRSHLVAVLCRRHSHWRRLELCTHHHVPGEPWGAFYLHERTHVAPHRQHASHSLTSSTFHVPHRCARMSVSVSVSVCRRAPPRPVCPALPSSSPMANQVIQSPPQPSSCAKRTSTSLPSVRVFSTPLHSILHSILHSTPLHTPLHSTPLHPSPFMPYPLLHTSRSAGLCRARHCRRKCVRAERDCQRAH